MRVDDITREDEVVGTVHVTYSALDGSEGDTIADLDVGKRALDAFRVQDWGALHTLTPAALRKKDPKKSAAATKAAASRAANKAKNPSEPAPAAPTGSEKAAAAASATAPADDF